MVLYSLRKLTNNNGNNGNNPAEIYANIICQNVRFPYFI